MNVKQTMSALVGVMAAADRGFHIRSTCRLCGAEQLRPLLKLNDTPLANEYPRQPEGKSEITRLDGHPHDVEVVWEQKRYPLHLVGCEQCGHVQLPVVVDPKRLFPPDYPYQSGTSAVFREHLRELAGTIDGMLGDTVRVLDVACNDGTFVRDMRRVGLAADGVDPAAPGEHGLHRAFFTEDWARTAAQAGQRFDCITALNVFAHVDDLDDFTRGVKTLLEPCGLFVIEVAYLPDMVMRGIFDTIYHEHIAFHHLTPLVGFFKRHGMRMVDAHRIDSQGGSVRIFVRNCDGQHVGGDDGHNQESERLHALLAEEARAMLWSNVRELVNEVSATEKLIRRAAPLAVYGAPAKLCTLLHATGTAGCVEFVVDDNPLKVGRYVPGTHIPILPVSALYERRPKVVMLASWNFADEIKKRHGELGCEWLVPMGGKE